MRSPLVITSLLSLAVALGCDKPSGRSAPAPSASSAPASDATPSSTAPAVTTAAATTPSAAVTAPDTVIAQHVLVVYKGAKRAPKTVSRSKADAKARAGEALAKIQAGAAFEDVVKQYPDDAGSVDRMGSVGKFRRDAMDPAFSAAAFALQPGQVSDVVETPFGFHLIKRTQ
jgi:peptidyl-prolyl cis-trans isomerase NIMA-interacting 1